MRKSFALQSGHRLDTPGGRRYRPRPLWAAVALLVGLSAHAEVFNGAQLPDGSKKVGENRFRAPSDYKETLKYYQTVYPASAYPRKPIANQPGVKAVHISNPSRKNFEGLNIYEANDEVRIFVVPVGSTAKPVRKKTK